MEVFTFGNGDFLQQVFVAVSNLMGTGSFMTLVRITIMLSMLVMGYQLAFSLKANIALLGFFKHYFIVIMLFYAFMVPKTNVIIWDEYRSPNAMPAINNVPLGVALFAHGFTTVERGLTKMLETSFATPDDLKFSNSGYAFSVIALDNMKFATTSDPYFKRTMDDYVVNCFFTDVLWGDKDLNVVLTSNDIFAQMAPTHSAPLMSMSYDAAYPMGQQDSCQAIYTNITTNMGVRTSAALSKLSETMGLNVTARLPTVASSVLNVATTAQGIIQQAMVANSMKDGLAQTAMYTGVSGDAVAYSSALAQQQQQSQWTAAGELSKKYIPILRQILEAVVYGIFPILFLMMMSPWGKQAFFMYVSLLLWLVLWSPLFALLNLIINVRTTSVLAPATGYFSMGYMPFIYQSTADVTAMAGYMAWLVPTLAFAIAKLSDSAMVHAMSGVASSTNLTQSRAASATTGPEGASHSAAAAAQFKAANIYGGSAIMSGMAAKSIYSMQNGMALDDRGIADTGNMAGNQVKTSAFGAQSGAATVDTLTASVGGGNEMGAATTVGTAGGQKQAGELKALQNAAAPYGGIENFARALSDKNYAQASSVIDNYAKSQGISFGQAAGDVGRIMGDREAVSAEAFKNVQDTVGRDGQVFTDTNKGLNETAKFQQAYGFAHDAGYAGGKDDFQGMYNAHSAHHGQESWTLDGARAGWLNDQARDQGSGVRFAAGDRVSMSRGADGTISLAKGEAGFSKDSLDISRAQSGTDISEVNRSHADLNLDGAGMKGLANEIRGNPRSETFVKALDGMAASGGGAVHLEKTTGGKLVSATAGSGGSAATVDFASQKTGWEKVSQAISKSEKGSQSWSGNRSQHDNTSVSTGAMQIDKPGGKPGEKSWVQGEIYSATDPKTGKQQVIGGSYRNGIDNSTIDIMFGSDGGQQAVVSEGKLDKNNRWVAGSRKSLSTSDTHQGGYAVHQIWNGTPGKGGNLLYDESKAGQTVSDHHSYRNDQTKGLDRNAGATYFGNDQNLRERSTAQIAGLAFNEGANQAADTASKLFIFKRGFTGSAPKSAIPSPKGSTP
jgi:hypothetical protein